MAQQVLILGAGALGTALARAIPKERGQVYFWDIDESKCPGGRLPLEQIVPAVDWVFLCVSSWAVRAALAPVSVQKPSPSGPRCLSASVSRRTRSGTRAFGAAAKTPAIPHMCYCLKTGWRRTDRKSLFMFGSSYRFPPTYSSRGCRGRPGAA